MTDNHDKKGTQNKKIQEADGNFFADLHWNEDGQPISSRYDDVYFSRHNGLDETRYVFLEQNKLVERWQSFLAAHSNNDANNFNNTFNKKDTFIIGETGFGTGLNFLAAWQLWDQLHKELKTKVSNKTKKLHFVSVEKFPLRHHDLQHALRLWPSLKDYAEKLLAVYDDYDYSGFKQYRLSENVTLTLIINDAVDGFNELIASDHPYFREATFTGIENQHEGSSKYNGIDAWFLDGFSPAKNPEMWSDALFSIMGELSHENTTLATFTAAGFVKRGLENVGFTIKKEKGFAHKRELITGIFEPSNLSDSQQHDQQPNKLQQLKQDNIQTSAFTSPYPVPWMVDDRSQRKKAFQLSANSIYPINNERSVAIIGAGLAGCFTAHALASRGYTVTIFDAENSPASQASGNSQGIVYGKLSKDSDGLAQLNIAALAFAENFYQQFWQSTHSTELGQACGVLQLAHNEKEKQLYLQLQERFPHSSRHIKILNAEQASDIAGIAIDHPALYFPHLGWINPHDLCHTLIEHPNIHFVGNTKIEKLASIEHKHDHENEHKHEHANEHSEKPWTLFDDKENVASECDIVILATATAVKQFDQTEQLPVKNIRGQVTQFDLPQSNSDSFALKTVICGDGYIAPLNQKNNFSIGATFTLHNNQLESTEAENIDNMTAISQSIPATENLFSSLTNEHYTGRAGFRCSTPDYLPIVGPVHNHDAFVEKYALLRKNANASIPVAGSYQQNLFINVGYGSRGLAYAPLCSEYLAAKIHGDIWPMSRTLANAIHPARFTIKNLIRRKI